MGRKSSQECDARVILNLMNTKRLWTEKWQFLDEMMKQCSAGSKSKGTRKMSGWQCYLKHCSQEKSFQECIGDNSRKEKEYIPNKEFYSIEAENGCSLE